MEWKEVVLGELVDIYDSKRIPLTSQEREKIKGDIPYYGAQGIIDYINQFLFDGEYILIAEDGNNIKSRQENIAQIAKGKFWVNNHAHILQGKIEQNLLCYIINHTDISGYVTGSAQPKLNQANLLKIPIKIPVNLSDQRKIAGILSALDAKIENNNKINANLEAQAQALFKSWFVDFTPFKDQPFVDSELGPIPQGWKVGKINEFVDVIYGAPYKSKLFNTQKEGLPLIRIRDLKTCSPQFYTKELLPNTELVNYGDVVAGMDAEFTPHIWLGETGLLNQRVCKFKPHTGISPLYSMFMIKPKLEFAQNYKVGTTVSHLGKSDIDKFIVIVPPLDIVKEASSIFDAILNEQINLAKENQRLAALRDTLLPKLMSGEIKL